MFAAHQMPEESTMTAQGATGGMPWSQQIGLEVDLDPLNEALVAQIDAVAYGQTVLAWSFRNYQELRRLRGLRDHFSTESRYLREVFLSYAVLGVSKMLADTKVRGNDSYSLCSLTQELRRQGGDAFIKLAEEIKKMRKEMLPDYREHIEPFRNQIFAHWDTAWINLNEPEQQLGEIVDRLGKIVNKAYQVINGSTLGSLDDRRWIQWQVNNYLRRSEDEIDWGSHSKS